MKFPLTFSTFLHPPVGASIATNFKKLKFITVLTFPYISTIMQMAQARRVSEYTIKHYQQTFRVFYEFLAYTYCEDEEDINRIYETAPSSEKTLLPTMEKCSLF